MDRLWIILICQEFFYFSRISSLNYIATILYSYVVSCVFYIGRLHKFEIPVQILREEHGCRWFTRVLVPKSAGEELVNLREREKPVKNVLPGMDHKYAQKMHSPVGNLLRNCIWNMPQNHPYWETGAFIHFLPSPLIESWSPEMLRYPHICGQICWKKSPLAEKIRGKRSWGGTSQYSETSFTCSWGPFTWAEGLWGEVTF